MANAQPKDIEATLGGVKYQCARQRNLKIATMEREDCLMKTLILSAFTYKDIRFIKHYIDDVSKFQKWAVCVSCNSKVVGLKSRIDTYTNTDGVSHEAHYTIYNHYLGSCKKLGKEPIYYDGNFPYVDFKDCFDIVLPPTPSPEAFKYITLSHFIVPKTD